MRARAHTRVTSHAPPPLTAAHRWVYVAVLVPGRRLQQAVVDVQQPAAQDALAAAVVVQLVLCSRERGGAGVHHEREHHERGQGERGAVPDGALWVVGSGWLCVQRRHGRQSLASMPLRVHDLAQMHATYTSSKCTKAAILLPRHLSRPHRPRDDGIQVEAKQP
jgi:hypothetical protein